MNDLGRDLELRLVRYFTVVAEHQHFGRAAADLHVAQPALSRQIQRLEKYLGTRLLDRTSQGTRLTPAGRTFLPRAQALLQAARGPKWPCASKPGASASPSVTSKTW
ncbi:LysR family transcriptional regulator [Nonomuraea ceibae]|uniref:LysR family transcriptional regulator n=1 Tax=Nonomuraea ceibae TaxID=1935170 RepID=UPI001C5F6069|nr:LysR family transcriptional regulator [Nonomuraea ceibae]